METLKIIAIISVLITIIAIGVVGERAMNSARDTQQFILNNYRTCVKFTSAGDNSHEYIFNDNSITINKKWCNDDIGTAMFTENGTFDHCEY